MRFLTKMGAATAFTALIACQTTTGGAFYAQNQLRGHATGPDSFEIISRAGAFNVDYWCAAADYVRRVYGQQGSVPIYVTQAESPAISEDPARWTSIKFAMSPPASGALGPSTTISLIPGQSLSQSTARSYCREIFFFGAGV